MIKEFQAFLTLFRQGKELANSATWKNRTIAANALTACMGAVLVIAGGVGYDLHDVTPEQVSQASAGIVAIVGLVNSIMHVLTSAKVGPVSYTHLTLPTKA